MKNNSKIISYVLLLATGFIIYLFTMNYIFDLQANIDLKNSKQVEEKNKRAEITRLKFIKQKLEKTKDMEVEKYLQIPTEDEIIDYIYSMVEDGNLGKTVPISHGLATIKSISMTKAKKNELGFLESDITLNISTSRETRLKDILDFFVSKTSKYKFFIDSFSYEKPDNISIIKGEGNTSIDVTIPLKVFYK